MSLYSVKSCLSAQVAKFFQLPRVHLLLPPPFEWFVIQTFQLSVDREYLVAISNFCSAAQGFQASVYDFLELPLRSLFHFSYYV